MVAVLFGHEKRTPVLGYPNDYTIITNWQRKALTKVSMKKIHIYVTGAGVLITLRVEIFRNKPANS